MLATYLIGLREGLEATLVVSILIAFLVKSDRRDRLPEVWIGVGLAVLLSVVFGWLLSYTETPLYALIGGILTAIAIGYLMFATAVRINLATFFTVTGTLLILVAAGIFKYGVHGLQEAQILPGINIVAHHLGAVLDPSTWYAVLLTGMFNVTAEPTVLEVVAWIAYVVPVLALFLWRPRRKPVAAAPAKSVPAAAPQQ
jgi:high-affinity Fe2+/Pb2+ permease